MLFGRGQRQAGRSLGGGPGREEKQREGWMGRPQTERVVRAGGDG